MKRYELYVEETQCYRQIIEADTEEGVWEVFFERQRTGRAFPYASDIHYSHIIPQEADDA